jgi:hypothetical protein
MAAFGERQKGLGTTSRTTVPILITSSQPDNQLNCIAARIAEAQAGNEGD